MTFHKVTVLGNEIDIYIASLMTQTSSVHPPTIPGQKMSGQTEDNGLPNYCKHMTQI